MLGAVEILELFNISELIIPSRVGRCANTSLLAFTVVRDQEM